MSDTLSRIDPPACGCNDCCTGYSRPFSGYGDTEQFRGLLHGYLRDAVGDDEPGAWMHVAARECPQRLAEFLAREFTAGRLVSRHALQARAANRLLGRVFADIFDD